MDSNLLIVMVDARNPLNLGAAARAISNFGFQHLRVVNPYSVAFRDARSAVGASHILTSAEEFSNLADALADCSLVVGTTALARRDLHHPLRALPDGARHITRRLATGRVAIVFGSEKRGLTNQHLSHCHWLMRIPTREEHGSMNLGQAVAVCLYELARRRPSASPVPRKKDALVSSGSSERITQLLFESLQKSGYIKRGADAMLQERLRRMVRRLRIPAADAELWLGMLRQIAWKLDGGSPDDPRRPAS